MIGGYNEQPPKFFQQGLFEESSTKKHRIGTVRALDDGRVFVYAKAGALALLAGKLTQGYAVDTALLECVADDAAINDDHLHVTPGATTAAANFFQDGYCHVNKNTGIGHLYKIRGHKAIASSTKFQLDLYDPIRVALASSAEVSLLAHPQAGVLIHTSNPTAWLAGVAPVPVTAAYYFWNQVKGPCCVLTEGTLVAGNNVTASASVDGAVAPCVLTEGTPNTGLQLQICGTVISVNITAEYSLINLAIPGY